MRVSLGGETKSRFTENRQSSSLRAKRGCQPPILSQRTARRPHLCAAYSQTGTSCEGLTMHVTTEASEGGLVSIVDDDASVRRSTGRLIRSFGFRTEAFRSGED